jgi:hypothetical protein
MHGNAIWRAKCLPIETKRQLKVVSVLFAPEPHAANATRQSHLHTFDENAVSLTLDSDTTRWRVQHQYVGLARHADFSSNGISVETR